MEKHQRRGWEGHQGPRAGSGGEFCRAQTRRRDLGVRLPGQGPQMVGWGPACTGLWMLPSEEWSGPCQSRKQPKPGSRGMKLGSRRAAHCCLQRPPGCRMGGRVTHGSPASPPCPHFSGKVERPHPSPSTRMAHSAINTSVRISFLRQASPQLETESPKEKSGLRWLEKWF